SIDPHLLAHGGLLATAVSGLGGGPLVGIPALPVEFGDGRERASLDRQPPKIGEHAREILGAAGYSEQEIIELCAAGVLGAATSAEPDGHTILMVTDAMVTIDPHLATSNHFDLSKAMEPVVNVAWSPLLLAAANNVPANSVAEFVALGKQKTQNLSFGSPGS